MCYIGNIKPTNCFPLMQVERCRMQLFGCADVSGDPPEPRPLWRDDCSCILHKEVSYSLKILVCWRLIV